MVKRYYDGSGIPTLAVALAEYMNADELKMLAALTKSRSPSRKTELVEHILKFLAGDRLRTPVSPRGAGTRCGTRLERTWPCSV